MMLSLLPLQYNPSATMILPLPPPYSEIIPLPEELPKALNESLHHALNPGPFAYEGRYPKSRPSNNSQPRTAVHKLDPIVEETTQNLSNDPALGRRTIKSWRSSWRSSCPTAVDLELELKPLNCNTEGSDPDLPVHFHINTSATDLYTDTDSLLHSKTPAFTERQPKALEQGVAKTLELPFIRDDDFQYYPLVPLSRSNSQTTVCDENVVGTAGKVQRLKRMSLAGKKRIWERIVFKKEGWRLLGRKRPRKRDA